MREWPRKVVRRYSRGVFLDRDGTINVDTDFPHKIEELEFVPKAVEGLGVLAPLPLHIIVVSNQAGIALKIFTRREMSAFNNELRRRVRQARGRIDAFYFCPHLERKHLREGAPACSCSKPAPGMLLEAADDFQLDLSECFVIGDKTVDMAAGEEAGCITILVRTGNAGEEDHRLPVRPRHVAKDMEEASLIVQSYLQGEAIP